MNTVETWYEEWKAAERQPAIKVLLSYAQSLDGSITRAAGASTVISGAAALKLTHWLRAQSDALLVGIGTIEIDDPQLTVRLAAGPSPTPVILDPRLELSTDARVLRREDRKPWIFTRPDAPPDRFKALVQAGATIYTAPAGLDGKLDLQFVLRTLEKEGVRRLMVEGGIRVISSFLAQRLADGVVLTIAPVWLAGVTAPLSGSLAHLSTPPRILRPQMEQRGEDWVVFGALTRG